MDWNQLHDPEKQKEEVLHSPLLLVPQEDQEGLEVLYIYTTHCSKLDLPQRSAKGHTEDNQIFALDILCTDPQTLIQQIISIVFFGNQFPGLKNVNSK